MSIESLKSEPVAATSSRERAETQRASQIYLGALAASFFVAYLPTYLTLANGAWQTEQEGHGPLIMLAAGGWPGSSGASLRRLRSSPRHSPVGSSCSHPWG
jgi:hypothetical protein